MGVYEGVNKVNDSIELVSGLISSKREFIIKQAANSVLLFIILIIFGCLDFATLEFHGEYLLTPSYWGTIGSKMLAAIIALNIGINIMLDNEIKKSEELIHNISIYNRLIQKKDTDFEYFVNEVFNPKLKVKAYKNKINRQIYLLNKFSRKRSRLLYSQKVPTSLDEKNYKLQCDLLEIRKNKNKYCRKRAELEKLKSEEYIKENLDSLAIKYTEVDAAIFELEINGAQKSEGVRVSGNIILGRAKESSSIIMSMLCVSMLTTSFVLGASKEVFADQMVAFWHYCLKVVEDIGVVLWQFFNGTIRTRKIVSTQLTQPYAGRNTVLLEYINWRESTNAIESPAFKEISKNFKEENPHEDIVEMTEEEYEAIKQKMEQEKEAE